MERFSYFFAGWTLLSLLSKISLRPISRIYIYLTHNSHNSHIYMIDLYIRVLYLKVVGSLFDCVSNLIRKREKLAAVTCFSSSKTRFAGTLGMCPKPHGDQLAVFMLTDLYAYLDFASLSLCVCVDQASYTRHRHTLRDPRSNVFRASHIFTKYVVMLG